MINQLVCTFIRRLIKEASINILPLNIVDCNSYDHVDHGSIKHCILSTCWTIMILCTNDIYAIIQEDTIFVYINNY